MAENRHFTTAAGVPVANNTDIMTAGTHGRDLFTAIECGDFPKWTMFIQMMTEEQARHHRHNPFDITKVWPKSEYPLIDVGELELNRNQENYFAEVEQSAFSPANVVPGISFSPDKMLQALLFSYADAQRYRLVAPKPIIPTAIISGPTKPPLRNRQCRSMAMARAGIIASMTITGNNRAICSAP